jgi:hypothetical protein
MVWIFLLLIMTSDPFHGIHRGCKVVAKKQPSQTPRHMIEGRSCITHHVDLCACGHTWDHGLTEEERMKRTTKPAGISKS